MHCVGDYRFVGRLGEERGKVDSGKRNAELMYDRYKVSVKHNGNFLEICCKTLCL